MPNDIPVTLRVDAVGKQQVGLVVGITEALESVQLDVREV